MSDNDLFQQTTTPEQIRGREFPSVRRGYDPDQVRDYLDTVATRLESMERELRETQHSIQQTQEQASSPEDVPPQEAQPEKDPYDAFGKTMASLLATANKEGGRLIKEAKAEAKSIMGEARSEAAHIRAEADAQVDQTRAEMASMLEQTRGQADGALSGLAGRRRVLADQLEATHSRLLEAAKSLEVIMEEAITEAGATPDSSDTFNEQDPAIQANSRDLANGSDLPDFSGIEFDLDRDERHAQDP
jgi:DivIVA domain-containing protein